MAKHKFEIHPSFKLNGTHFSRMHLHKVAYSFIKEGQPFEERVGNFLLDWLNEDYNDIKVRTSGSTGEPKEIFIGKQKMVNSAIATGKHFKVNEETKALMCLPPKHIGGMMMMVRAMTLGWHIDVVKPTSNPLDQLYKTYDFCAMTPFQLDNSLNRLHLIKKLIVGGGHISENLKQMVQGIPTKVYETFGMTETVSHIAARKVNNRKSNKTEPKPFKTLPNISVAADENNRLIIKAPKLLDEPLLTHDIVEIETYKKFYWKGRADNVINSGGIKIHPEEVEKKLQKLITQRFFISAIPDDALGEKVVLFVELPFSEKTISDLNEAIHNMDELTKYEKPKKIYLVEKFEQTPSGKVNRKLTVSAEMQ
ncbi:AMP-binding protein [Flavobacteriaceae bacterium 14752]|uniref:AMP-binding protein n=1 Tax=Mesohalobacter salilacus TaxID=2491711 RepID=UPI000F62F6C8|nr:O-succinylbenzoic acid--CoA ligase [Flavobacteriaceae bacterium 14752]